MPRYRLTVEYDGGPYCGFQAQAEQPTVQAALERAIEAFCGERIRVHAAGRTDTGVHASAQVIHFDTDVIRPKNAWVRGPNACLDPAIRVLWSHEVPDDFHARYSALSRSYRYLLLDDPVAPAILRGRVGWFHMRLDVDRMREACAALVGEHDFSAFRGAECQARSPIRTLSEARVERQSNLVAFTFRANAFLHHMIRNIVGSLVYVGADREEPAWIAELMASRDRRKAAPTFAASGLYLAGVEYDPELRLPAFRETSP